MKGVQIMSMVAFLACLVAPATAQAADPVQAPPPVAVPADGIVIDPCSAFYNMPLVGGKYQLTFDCTYAATTAASINFYVYDTVANDWVLLNANPIAVAANGTGTLNAAYLIPNGSDAETRMKAGQTVQVLAKLSFAPGSGKVPLTDVVDAYPDHRE